MDEQLRSYRIEVSELTVVGRKGEWKTVGTLVNNSGKSYESVVLLVHVYNAEGARLQQQVIRLSNVWPNEKFVIKRACLA